MSGPVVDPDVLNSLDAGSAAPPAGAVTDPGLIQHLEGQGASAVPPDAVAGANGLMWNKNGGYDPHTGELVIAGKPWTQPTPSPVVSAATAATSGMLNGVPIAGPALASGAQRAAAGINSVATGTPYDQNLSNAQEIVSRDEQANPGITAGANVAGAVAGTLPLAGTALGARALGLVGGTGARIAQGIVGGGAIGAADSAARGNSPIAGAEAGGALGGVAPVAGKAIGAIANTALGMLPTGLTGPLTDLGSTARNMLGNAVQGETPQTIDAAHQTLGPAGFVGDLNNHLSRLTKSVADQPDGSAGDIRAAYAARSAADGARINNAITAALGPQQNLAALTMSEQTARANAANPLYAAWRNTPVPPTPELLALESRLQAAGVAGPAANKAAIEGMPSAHQWFTTNPTTGAMSLNLQSSPTAQVFDYMKQALDDKIGGALSQNQRGQARLYQGLKSDLVSAIDNHPDSGVAGVWQQARRAWSDPTSIMTARQNGASALSRNTNADELEQEWNNYSPPEQMAFVQGVRGNIANIFGATKNGDVTVKNQLLAPNSQQKLQYLIGPDKTQSLVDALSQEDALAAKGNKITGGSPTNENINANALTGPAAIPGKVHNYVSNFAIDKPGSWLGVTPGSVISEAEARNLATARSRIAPILTTPNGPNAELARQLLGMASQRAGRQAAAGNVGSLATALINGAGQGEVRKYLPSADYSGLAQMLLNGP